VTRKIVGNLNLMELVVFQLFEEYVDIHLKKRQRETKKKEENFSN